MTLYSIFSGETGNVAVDGQFIDAVESIKLNMNILILCIRGDEHLGGVAAITTRNSPILSCKRRFKM